VENSAPIKVLIVDDHAILRAGVRILIETNEGIEVVGEAGDRAAALALVEEKKPDLILLDLDLGGESGLDLIRELLSIAPASRVLILTGVRDPGLHQRAVRLGAMGIVSKEKAADVLIKAIEKIHAGEVWLDRSMTANVLAELAHPEQARRDDPEAGKLATLTDREKEIITLVCGGLKNKQIADKLFISEATVRNHLTSILSKLDLSDRFELAIYSYRHHLAEPPR
jgi:two-component system, NarL family, nitrate/nitrite response regulator NarL